ncbi:P2X purinoceptor 4 [Fasciolopsis buskii]|uniref:P2X purinoceptor 4 n=1 Tax=Fasciolopsis buskii TaxID=27845 RepID=A0A8E0VKA5_9TREM|nr:P2X purinoceptor 4 [Fasciolopsis buski]
MTRIAPLKSRRCGTSHRTEFSTNYSVIITNVQGILNDTMFVFEMPKVVHIRNPALAILFRLAQISILTYFVIFVMWWNKGYQSFDRALSGVTVKVRGVTWVGVNGLSQANPLLDNGDYELQSLQNSGVYLTTRIRGKATQRLGYCAELVDLPDARCSTDEHCTPGSTAGHSVQSQDAEVFDAEEIDLDDDGHGVFTGRCIHDMKVCEIYGWCPVSESTRNSKFSPHASPPHVVTPVNILQEPFDLFTNLDFLQQHRSYWEPNSVKLSAPLFDVLNYTFFIRSAIEFPYFDVKRRNILPWMTEHYLHTCMYDPISLKNQYCPVFRVHDMIRLAGANPDRMLYFGGVIAITIDWSCDLDWSVEYCVPKYEFRQLDHMIEQDKSDRLITGAGLAEGSLQEITIHYGHDKSSDPNRYRLLLTTQGIAFIIRVTGQAGKFNLLSFTMRFGSGLALLGGATIMCDLIVFHFMSDREHFREVTCDDKTLRRLLSMSTTNSRRIHLTRRNAFHVRRKMQPFRQNNDLRDSAGPVKGINHTSALMPLITLSTTSFPRKKSEQRGEALDVASDLEKPGQVNTDPEKMLKVESQRETDNTIRLSRISTRSSVSQYCYPIGLDVCISSPMYSSQMNASSSTSIGSKSSISDVV